jgi:phosphoglucosamine mutase
MKREFFGTDGVRGPYGGPVINEAFAARLGLAAARWAGGVGTVYIGRDTRASGASLATALAAGLEAGGMVPVLLGVTPTPAVARAVASAGAALGAVITASHNPAEDNGIKFFAHGGLKLTDADEALIEAHLPPVMTSGAPRGGGGAITEADGISSYIDSMTAHLPAGALAGICVVTDTANGATCATTPAVLRRLGANVIELGAAPDGLNINAGVGSEHPESLAAAVLRAGAQIGIAHDGDGDRCVLCDETGAVLDGDEILVLLAVDALRRGCLAADTLVVTVQSNLGVDAAVQAAGGKVERTDVGDRYVLARMRERGARLGGESSGHVINLDMSPTGDGLAAALGVLGVMGARGRPLSELRRGLVKFPQGQRNLLVKAKRPLEDCAALVAEQAALGVEFGDRGRAMVRFSGTEPKLRLLAEGENELIVKRALERLETAARFDLEVI